MGIALPRQRRVGGGNMQGDVSADVALPLCLSLPRDVAPQIEVVKDWTSPSFVSCWQMLYDRASKPSPVFDPAYLIPYLASHRNTPPPIMLGAFHRLDGHAELSALMLLSFSGRGLFKALFRTPDIAQQDVGALMFCEPLLTSDVSTANQAVESIFQYLHKRRAYHPRLVLKGLRSAGAVASVFRASAARCGLPFEAVEERSPTLGLDFEPSARNLPLGNVVVFNILETLKPALERFLAIDALSGDINQEPLVNVTGMAIFLRALVRSMSARQRIRIAMIDTESVQIAALAIETETETFLWRVVGRDRTNPTLEAALSAAIQSDSGKDIHAATDAPLSGLGLKPLPLTSLRFDLEGAKGVRV